MPQTQAQEIPKPKTAAEEQADEEIGAASLAYDNVDESGNGIHGRQISPAFHDEVAKIKKEADPQFKGVLKIITCIDQLGNILLARPDVGKTTMNEMPLQRKVGKVLIDQNFEPDPSAPERQCGLVIVEF